MPISRNPEHNAELKYMAIKHAKAMGVDPPSPRGDEEDGALAQARCEDEALRRLCARLNGLRGRCVFPVPSHHALAGSEAYEAYEDLRVRLEGYWDDAMVARLTDEEVFNSE